MFVQNEFSKFIPTIVFGCYTAEKIVGTASVTGRECVEKDDSDGTNILPSELSVGNLHCRFVIINPCWKLVQEQDNSQNT